MKFSIFVTLCLSSVDIVAVTRTCEMDHVPGPSLAVKHHPSPLSSPTRKRILPTSRHAEGRLLVQVIR